MSPIVLAGGTRALLGLSTYVQRNHASKNLKLQQGLTGQIVLENAAVFLSNQLDSLLCSFEFHHLIGVVHVSEEGMHRLTDLKVEGAILGLQNHVA